MKKEQRILSQNHEEDIETWLEFFLLDRRIRHVSTGSILFYRQKLGIFLNWCEDQGLTSITEIGPNQLRLFLYYLEKRGHNAGGRHAFHRSVRAFLNFCQEESELEGRKNPIKKVPAPKVLDTPLEPVSSEDGIDTLGLFIDPTGTGRSVNLMYQDGRRKNFYDGKGHMELRPDLELCGTVLFGAKLAHFHLPNWARILLPIARDLGVTIACDIQDITTADDPYSRDFINYADILFLSAANYEDPLPIIETFFQANPDLIVVVGRGAQGCLLASKDSAIFFPAVEMEAPVIDTNGAGDSLAVGFLSSYVLDGYSLTDSIWRGQIAARFACTIKGSSSGLISREQLDRFHENISTDVV